MTEQMKESGIQWIGAIPYNWNVERIKYIIQNNDNGIKVEQDYGVICMEHKSGSGYDVQPGQWDDIAANGETASGFFICEWE